ncbi:MAG: PIG-L family deacetylase [Alphaproteobacteria bacterium]|nr:PIG-L family deacetylase [Alphaproteobacteria bacterium]
MNTVLVVAPHPDDETLGCGGAILRHAAAGDAVHWCIVTAMHVDAGYTEDQIAARAGTIADVAAHYGFAGVHELGHPTANLDRLPRAELVGSMSAVVGAVSPTRVYLPHPSDSHSDHRIVFEAAAACTKWFRYASIREVFAYETLSETGFGIDPSVKAFRPNAYIDITGHLEGKIAATAHYASEFADHPFPRSEAGVRALATLRGGEAGYAAAEAFMLLRSREG